MLTAIIFVALAAIVAADSECPDAKPVAHYDMNAYTGGWYEVARYENGMKRVESCYLGQSTVDGDKLKIKSTFIYSGKPGSAEVIASYADDSKSGNVTVKMTIGGVHKAVIEYSTLVVAIDYDKYALTFTCFFDEKSKSNKEMFWVYSRTKTLEGEAKTEIKNFIKSSGYLDWDKLIWIDNSEEACKPNE